MSEVHDPLATLLLHVDSSWDPLASHESVRDWPDGSVERFEELGLLVPLAPFTVTTCEDCGDFHDVVYLKNHRGGTTLMAFCPEFGGFDVDPATLRRWRFDVDRFAHLVAHELGLSGTPEGLVDGRLWRLGRVYESETWCAVHLGLALHHQEAGPIRDRLPERAICLVPRHLPDTASGDRVFLPLDEIATWNGSGLVLDGDAFVSVEVPGRRRPKRRRATRLAAIEVLEGEMAQHLREARDHAFDTKFRTDVPKLLPRPKRYELAARCQLSEAAVSRAFNESDVLQRLWDLAADLHGLMAHADDFVSSVSPVGRI